jgi:hypothetical protein
MLCGLMLKKQTNKEKELAESGMKELATGRFNGAAKAYAMQKETGRDKKTRVVVTQSTRKAYYLSNCSVSPFHPARVEI